MKKRVFVILIIVIIICLAVIGVLFYKLNNNSNKNNSTNSNSSLKSSKETDNNDDTIISNNPVDNSNQETSNNTLNSIKNTNAAKTNDANNNKNESKKSSASTSSGSSGSSKTKYSCPSGTTLDGTICIEKKKAQVTYKCVYGEQVGDSCIVNTSVPANVTYTCSSGELRGDTCYKSESVLSFNESQFSGYSQTMISSMYDTFVSNCIRLNGSVENRNGIKVCIVETPSLANASYDCNGKEGTLAGDMCISAKVEKAFAEYRCDSGYGLDVPYCIKTTPATKIK